MPLDIRRCVIAGRGITSVDDFYDEVSRQLSFPGHFGRNLDALWDILTTDITGPFEIAWEDAAFSRAAMGQDFTSIAALLLDVAGHRADFHVAIRD